MGVSSSAMIRMAFVGGLATMGMCLVWMGASRTSHHLDFPPALGDIQIPLPPTVAAAALPIPIPALSVPRIDPTLPQSRFVHYEGTIHGSLFEAAIAQGVPVTLLTEMIKIFSYDVDFQRDIQPDDRFELMYERVADGKKTVPRLLFASLTLSGKELKLYRYEDRHGDVDYYTPEGESAKKALLKTPVDGARISSGFGMRFHPILHYTTQHKGIDFAVMTGTPVMAAGTGTVEFAGHDGSYGIYVRIKHDAVHSTAYAHLSRLAPGIRPGRHVTQGQTIAYSGSTGRSTGPHLHYEVLVNGSQVNPMSVKFQSGRKLGGRELARFRDVEREDGARLAETPATTRTASR